MYLKYMCNDLINILILYHFYVECLGKRIFSIMEKNKIYFRYTIFIVKKKLCEVTLQMRIHEYVSTFLEIFYK